MPWIERVLAVGQADCAVLIDLPSGLLIAVALGMGRRWTMARPPEGAAPSPIGALVGIFRRAREP